MKNKLSGIINKAKSPSTGEILAAVNRGDEKVDGADVLEKPYQSQAQARYVHAKAGEGEQWAKKFVEHSAGQKVGELPEKVEKAGPTGAISPVREVKLDQPKVEAWQPKARPTRSPTTKVVSGKQSFAGGVPDPMPKPESLYMQGHDKWNQYVDSAATHPGEQFHQGGKSQALEDVRISATHAQKAHSHLSRAQELAGNAGHVLPELYQAAQGLGQAKMNQTDPTPHQAAFNAAAAKLPNPEHAKEIVQNVHKYKEHKNAFSKFAGQFAPQEHHEEIYNSAVNWRPGMGKSLNKSVSIVRKLKKSLPTAKDDKQEAGEKSPSVERMMEAPKEGDTRPFIGTKEAFKALKERHKVFKHKIEQDRCDGDADATAIYSMTEADVKKKIADEPRSLEKSKPNYKTLRSVKLPDGTKVNVYGNNGYERISNGEHRGRYLHSVMAEHKLGRKLKSNEEIDHKNGDRKANGLNNLRLTNTSAHASHTNTERAQQGGFTGEHRYMHSREYTEGKPESMEKGLHDYTEGELSEARKLSQTTAPKQGTQYKGAVKGIVDRMKARRADDALTSHEIATELGQVRREEKQEFPKGTGAPAWQFAKAEAVKPAVQPAQKPEKKPNEMTMPELREATRKQPSNLGLVQEYVRRRGLGKSEDTTELEQE